MIRTFACAAAAVLLTTGAVAAMADTGDRPVVTISKTGDYCVHTPAITGSLLPQVECHSVGDWAKQGVTFARR